MKPPGTTHLLAIVFSTMFIACGGEGPFAADFNASLPPEAVVDDLTAVEKQRLCEEIALYAQLAFSERAQQVFACRVDAVLVHAPDVAACEDARAACGEVGLVDVDPPDTSYCETAVVSPCATTVGALEACYSATRILLADGMNSVACTMGPAEAAALMLFQPPECATPRASCPAYFPGVSEPDATP